MVFFDYMKPYVDEIFPIIYKNNSISLSDLNKQIKLNYQGRDVLFITQAETKYISSWLNIFRDDFGFLDFKSKKVDRKIQYNPLNISRESLINKIKIFSKAKAYLEQL